jgi:hypothetical protein
MRIAKLLLGVMISALLVNIPSANAALDGCPNTWPAPTKDWVRSSGLPQELKTIQEKRPFDVVVNFVGLEYSKDSVTWVAAGKTSVEAQPLFYAFAGGKEREVWKVQVKDCGEAVNRYYESDLSKLKDPIENKDIKSFFNDPVNRERFGGPRNFQEYEAFLQNYEKCKTEINTNASIYDSQLGSKVIWGINSPSRNSCYQLQSAVNGFQLFFKDSNCHTVDNGIYRIAIGAKCEVFLGVYYYPGFSFSYFNFYSFTEFQIQGPITKSSPTPTSTASQAPSPNPEAWKSQRITITCVKGKLTKKVTAIKPKCTAGYKKK